MALGKKKASRKKKAPAATVETSRQSEAAAGPPPASSTDDVMVTFTDDAFANGERMFEKGQTVELNVHSAFRWYRRGKCVYA